MKTDKEIQADLQNVFKEFKGKINNERNRIKLANQCTTYLVNLLDTDLITYKSEENVVTDMVRLYPCYKGERILINGEMDLIEMFEKCLLHDTSDIRNLVKPKLSKYTFFPIDGERLTIESETLELAKLELMKILFERDTIIVYSIEE